MDTTVKRVLLLLCTLGLSCLSLFALGQPYAVPITTPVLLLCAVFCLLFGIPLLLSGAWRLLALLPLGALVYGVWRFLPQLLQSLPLLGNQYITAANHYHTYQWILPFAQSSAADPFWGVLALGLLVSLLVCIGMLLLRSVLFSALPLSIGLILGIFTNHFPALGPALGVVLCLGLSCLLFVPNAKGRSVFLYASGLSLVVALTLLSALVAPSLTAALSPSSLQLQHFQNNFTKTFYQDAKKIAPAAQLNNNSLRFTGRTALTLQTPHKPLTTVFLRERSYGAYLGGAWEPLPQAAFDQFAKDTNITGLQIAAIDYTALAHMETPVTTLNIQRYDGGGGLAPYNFIPQATTQDTYFLGDGYLISTQNPLQLKGYWQSTDQWETNSPIAYDQFASAQYLSVPNLPRVEALANVLAYSSAQDIYEEITRILAASASYSLDIPAGPIAGDYVENFLFTQKSGYCQHFASAATLLFRYKGIPARYVTGYSVPQSSFVEGTNGFTANVQDAMAHAWTEIYLPGKGWFPLEVTPGGVQEQLRTLPTPAATPTPTAEPTPSPIPAQAQQTPLPTPLTPTPVDKQGLQPLPALLPLVLIPLGLCLCALAALARRRYLTAKRLTSPALLLAGLLHMLELGLNEKQGNQSDRAFLEKALYQLQLQHTDALALLLEKHSFSTIPLSQAEQDQLVQLYTRSKKALRPTLSPFKRLLLNWVYCY